MKVNMLSTPMDGRYGIGNHAKLLITQERKLGINVNHISIEEERKNPFYWLKKAFEVTKNSEIVHIQYEYHFFGKLFSIVGIYTPLFYIFMYLLSFIYRFKIITTMHEVFEAKKTISEIFRIKKPHFNIFRMLYSIYSIFRNRSITKLSDAIIVHSSVNKDKLIRQGVPEKKIYLLPHGANKPIFLNKEFAKKKLALDVKKRVIAIFGYVNYNKGHDLLLKATKHLDKDIVILIVGDVRFNKHRVYFENIKKIADENVIFYGFVEESDFPTVLNAIDIMVLPYRKVSTSGILNWSLAYQIPTITSDLPYFKNINEKYGCLLLFKRGIIDSLHNTIKKLLNNNQLQNELKVASKKYYIDNSYEVSARQTTTLYVGIK